MNLHELTPPHSNEAEQAVLGGLLLDNRCFDHVANLLSGESFYHPQHRAIYSTIAQLIGAQQPADLVTVYEAGGHEMRYLSALAQSVVSAANVRAYAQIVLKHWRARELMRIGSGLVDDAMRGAAEPAELIDKTVTALLALERGEVQDEPRVIAELLGDFLDRLSARAEGRDDSIATGLDDLDRITGGGGREGELWVIGARPSMGKTAITLTLARNIALRGQVVLTLTQEDSNEMLVARQVAAAGRVNLADIRSPQRAPDSMWAGVTEGVEALQNAKLVIDDQAALTLRDVRRKIQQTTRRHGRPALVIIDYLQLMDADGEGDNRNQALGAISNGLGRVAKELGTWIVLLSQLNRKADERPTGPEMQDLRDSGDIEGAAHLIGLLHREAMRKPTDQNKHHAELRVVKQKNGPTGTVNLYFDGATQRFGNWDGPPPMRGVVRGGNGRGLD